MSTTIQAQVKARLEAKPASIPAQTGLLQRRSSNQTEPATHTFIEPRLGHNFSRMSVHAAVPGSIQTKLTVNQPTDKYEQEADQVAEQVMRMPEAPKSEVLRRQPEEEDEELRRQPMEEEDEETLQAKESPGQVPYITSELQTRINSIRVAGQSLSDSTRAFMEPRFGHDFSQVRIHNDARAAETARAVNARAYTVGRDIVFGAGQYAPGTMTGKRLLAHELTHVIQQGNTGGTSTRGGIRDTQGPFKGQAEAIARLAASEQGTARVNRFPSIASSGTPLTLQRSSSSSPGTVSSQEQSGSDTGVVSKTKAPKLTPAEEVIDSADTGPEIRQGLSILKGVTIGKSVEALNLQAKEIAGGGLTSQEIQELHSENATTSLLSASRHILYIANQIYILDRTGHITSQEFFFGPALTTLDPGGVYFSSNFLLGRRSSGPVTRARILLRVDGGEPKVAGGDLEPRYINENREALHNAIQSAFKEGAGVGVIVSPSFAKKKLSVTDIDPQKMVQALRGVLPHLPWAILRRLKGMKENWKEELFQQVSQQILGLCEQELFNFIPVIGAIKKTIDEFRRALWIAKLWNIAVYALGKDEIDLVSQALALSLVEWIIGKIVSGTIHVAKRVAEALRSESKSSTKPPEKKEERKKEEREEEEKQGGQKPAPSAKKPYDVNKHPRASDDEKRVGAFLHDKAQAGELPGVSEVEPRKPTGKEQIGDYVLTLTNGKKVPADLYQPVSGNPRSISVNALKKGGQAEVAVIELGKGKSAQIGQDGAHQIAQEVITTPSGINRVIIIKNGKVVVDVPR